MNGQELAVFHPIVLAWLEQQSYVCEHHAYLGRNHLGMGQYADFRAIHPRTGLQLIVECKVAQRGKSTVSSMMTATMSQLIHYQKTIKDPLATLALAIPEKSWTKRVMWMCAKSNITLILISEDFSPEIAPCPRYTDQAEYERLVRAIEQRLKPA